MANHIPYLCVRLNRRLDIFRDENDDWPADAEVHDSHQFRGTINLSYTIVIASFLEQCNIMSSKFLGENASAFWCHSRQSPLQYAFQDASYDVFRRRHAAANSDVMTVTSFVLT